MQIRSLPSNLEAEEILLGGLIINQKLLENIEEFLRSEHFFSILHQKIYQSIVRLVEKDTKVSIVTLNYQLANDENFINKGGESYLLELSSKAACVVDPYEYGRIIYDLAIKRELINIGEKVVNDAYDQDLTHSALSCLEDAENSLFNLASYGSNSKSFVPIEQGVKISMENIDRAIHKKGQVTGVSTGIKELDNILSGFQQSDLIIIAGRPSMGKTAVAINFAFNAAKYLAKTYQEEQEKSRKENFDLPNDFQMGSVGFFSLEMPIDQISTRLLSMISQIDGGKLKTGYIKEEEYNKLKKSAIELNNTKIHIDDSPSLTISSIRTRARKLKRKHNLSILIIDYLQLLSSSSKTTENRTLEISEITRGLKAIAKELQIPVIALSQLSRAVEQREDKKPMLSDLRESGAIEQDADIVMFVYREEYYITRSEPSPNDKEKYANWQKKCQEVKNQANLIIAKHRNGSIGNVKISYIPDISKISNLAPANML